MGVISLLTYILEVGNLNVLERDPHMKLATDMTSLPTVIWVLSCSLEPSQLLKLTEFVFCVRREVPFPFSSER